MLTDAALEGKIDRLNGLKENVIIGKLIPAATGLKRYRRIEIEPAEPLPRGLEDVGLLEGDDLAAELGLDDGDGLQGFGRSLEQDLAQLDQIGAQSDFEEGVAEIPDPDAEPRTTSRLLSRARPAAPAARRQVTRPSPYFRARGAFSGVHAPAHSEPRDVLPGDADGGLGVDQQRGRPRARAPSPATRRRGRRRSTPAAARAWRRRRWRRASSAAVHPPACGRRRVGERPREPEVAREVVVGAAPPSPSTRRARKPARDRAGARPAVAERK